MLFYIAKGSIAEIRTQLEIAQRVDLITAEQLNPLDAHCVIIAKMLGALIKARSVRLPRFDGQRAWGEKENQSNENPNQQAFRREGEVLQGVQDRGAGVMA